MSRVDELLRDVRHTRDQARRLAVRSPGLAARAAAVAARCSEAEDRLLVMRAAGITGDERHRDDPVSMLGRVPCPVPRRELGALGMFADRDGGPTCYQRDEPERVEPTKTKRKRQDEAAAGDALNDKDFDAFLDSLPLAQSWIQPASAATFRKGW